MYSRCNHIHILIPNKQIITPLDIGGVCVANRDMLIGIIIPIISRSRNGAATQWPDLYEFMDGFVQEHV